ncbi:acetate kinase [Aromatoleum diolicum]|uniref:Acetate kinase n=1 Tax=Aromatoleum diolicum TaxID=75796 RepID=A0ABX1Q7G5_9RHOO|nr:acetate kinase [Aromatoleum diolicum]NMG74010.1 acetate kinase [Aromatoleum diolicum]
MNALAHRQGRLLGCSLAGLVIATSGSVAHAEEGTFSTSMADLKRRVEEQSRQIESLNRDLAKQQMLLDDLQRTLDIASVRGRGTVPAGAAAAPSTPTTAQVTAAQPAQQVAQAPKPVGKPPERRTENRPPAVAPIFEQPGVLTPPGKWLVEPSLQYAHSSSNRIALVGYTIIPAILIGLIDVREVKSDTFIGALTVRRGITNRFELEAKIPYVYRTDTSVSRPVGAGAAADTSFDVDGHGLGDIELTGRYQLNDGGVEDPYYIASLRFKTRTGRDPFEVKVDRTIRGTTGTGLQTEMPTGSGFFTVQPGITVLLPSDPVVFFGGVSYQYSFARDNVKQKTNDGDLDLGKVQPGGAVGFNFGMGLALNDRSSFSIGYDHLSVGKVKVGGRRPTTSVRSQLGTLLLGYSYRLNSGKTLNLSIGAGLTDDAPDIQLTLRMPLTL